jgi:hypothetical protein
VVNGSQGDLEPTLPEELLDLPDHRIVADDDIAIRRHDSFGLKIHGTQ